MATSDHDCSGGVRPIASRKLPRSGRTPLTNASDGPYGLLMRLRKGMHVRELSKCVGRASREGRVLAVHGSTVEIQWDDGHQSSLTGALLERVRSERSTA